MPVAAVTVTLGAVTSGPVYPATGSDFYSVTGFKAKSLYLFTELSGTVFDRAGTVDLTESGTPTYSYESKGGRLGVLSDTVGDRHTNTTVNEPAAADSFIYGVVATHGGVGQGDIFGYMATVTRDYANIYVPNNNLGNVAWRLVSNASTQVTHIATGLAMTSGSNVRTPHLIIAQVDRAANVARLHVKRLGTAGVSTSGTLAAHTTFNIGDVANFGTHPGFSATGNSVHYAFVLTGSDAEGTTTPEKLAERLGWASVAVGTVAYTPVEGSLAKTLGAVSGSSSATSTISGWTPGWTQTKTGGGSGWNAGASSVESITGDGYIEFIAGINSDKMVGLSESDPNASYDTVKYAIYLDTSRIYRVYELGSLKGAFGTANANDVLRVQRSGTTISYYLNQTLFYTSLTLTSQPLFIDTSNSVVAGTIVDIRLFEGGEDKHFTWKNEINVTHATPRTLGAITVSSLGSVAIAGLSATTLETLVMSSVLVINSPPVLIIPAAQDNSRTIHFLERSGYDVSKTVGGSIRKNRS